MKDLGQKYDHALEASVPSKSYYETIRFSTKTFPELKKYKAGSKVMLQVECLVRSISTNETKEKTSADVSLEIRKGEVIEESDDENKEDKSKKIAKMFKADADSEDYSEDILRPPALETKANKFAKQLNS